MTRRPWTCATCRIEHTCTLSLVALSDHSSHHMAQARSHLSFTPSACHPCAAFFEFLSITFYFFLLFLFLFSFLMTDGDSVTIDNLRDSANGTFVTLDDCLPLTKTVHTSRSKATANPGQRSTVIASAIPLDGHEYSNFRTAVGKLIFMAPWRPDMQFAIQQLSTQVLNPTTEQARSEAVDTISQRHATHTHLSSS